MTPGLWEMEELLNDRSLLNFTGKSRRPVRRHFTAHFDRDNVATRQVSLQNMYSRLVEMAEVLYYLTEPLYLVTEIFHFSRYLLKIGIRDFNTMTPR